MYEIVCQECGRLDVHPGRTGAESKAESHTDDTGHPCSIEPMVDQ